jgi:hypothetical protein
MLFTIVLKPELLPILVIGYIRNLYVCVYKSFTLAWQLLIIVVDNLLVFLLDVRRVREENKQTKINLTENSRKFTFIRKLKAFLFKII